MPGYTWRGVGFPWDGTLAKFIEPKNDEDILRTSIQMILFTRKKQRVMLRSFGTDLETRVFDPNDVFLRNEIVQEIQSAINLWDDRIGIDSLNVVQLENDFSIQIVFYNAKDPMRTTRQLTVTLGELGWKQS